MLRTSGWPFHGQAKNPRLADHRLVQAKNQAESPTMYTGHRGGRLSPLLIHITVYVHRTDHSIGHPAHQRALPPVTTRRSETRTAAVEEAPPTPKRSKAKAA